MANGIDLDDYDFTDLHNYPNIGLNKDNEIVELSYDGNILLRPVNTKIFLTEEAEAEIEKCKNDMFYFFETYCKIHTQDGGKVLVQLRPYQKEFLDLIHNNRRVIGLLARQVGKCVEKKSLIKVRNKRTGVIEDITIEDFHLRVKNK